MSQSPSKRPFTPEAIAETLASLQSQYPLFADPMLWATLREQLVTPYLCHRQTGDALPEPYAGLIADRLERAEELLTRFTLPEWGLLCEAICPEYYTEPPEPPEPSREQPGSAQKHKVLSERADLGSSLWHAQDNSDLPDHIGRVVHSDSRTRTPTLAEVQLQGEERQEVGDEGYNPATRTPLDIEPRSSPSPDSC